MTKKGSTVPSPIELTALLLAGSISVGAYVQPPQCPEVKDMSKELLMVSLESKYRALMPDTFLVASHYLSTDPGYQVFIARGFDDHRNGLFRNHHLRFREYIAHNVPTVTEDARYQKRNRNKLLAVFDK